MIGARTFKHVIGILLVCASPVANAQLFTFSNNNASALAQVLAGPGVIISNATLNCGANGAGIFTCACSAGVSDGVILTSGTSANAHGPNNSGSITAATGNGFDGDLNKLSNVNTYDKCILEFDIFVTSDTLKFNFVFGSDEYLEYVGTSFNDVFGFFISGPGISGTFSNSSINLAVVPATTTPISINTVNNVNNSQYYIYNGNGGDAPYNVNPYFVQYDGLTTVLQAKTVVQPCQTYHLKLAIADGSDQILDSGVFLEANSVSSSGIILATTTSTPGFPFLVEGCNTGTISFTRTGSVANDTTFHFDIGGAAINDTDYVNIPDSITILKNQTTATLNIIPIVDGTSEGPEKVIIYIREPCTNTISDSIFVIIQDDIMPQISNDTTICLGGTAQLKALGGATYTWTPTLGLNNPNIFNPTASPPVTTTYSVTLHVATCTADTNVTVTIKPPVIVKAGNDTALCIGDTVQLNASAPGATYLKWTPTLQISGVNSLTPKIWTNVTRTYYLEAQDALGCTFWDTITITVNPLPNANAGPDKTTCSYAPVQLNASGGVSYVWTPANWLNNPNIPNPMAAPFSTTTFKVVVTDANGCKKADFVTVTTKSLPVAKAGPDKTICEGGSTVLNGSASGSPPFTYAWQPAGLLNNANIPTPLALGVVTTTQFILTVTNANGCVHQDTMIVFVNPKPIVTITPAAPAICIGASVQLVASGGATYTWSPTTALSASNIPNPVSTPAATITYTVNVASVNNCVNVGTVTVIVNPLAVANAGPDKSICIGQSVALNGSGGISYAWNPSTGLNDSTLASPTATPLVTTTYTLTVTDGNGCVDDDIVVVTVNPLPVANAGPDVVICNTTTTQLLATGGASYTWSPVTGLSNPNIANPVASPSATTTYVVTVTDANGCLDTDDVTVTVNPLPVADAGPDVAVCATSSTQLNGSGGLSYAWLPPTGLSNPNIANPVATPAITTNYILSVTDANGCTDNDALIVTVNPLPIANAGPDAPICIGGQTQLQGSGGTSYLWTPSTGLSDSTIASPIAQPVTTTTYVLTVTDNNGCFDVDDVTVTVNPLPVANAGPDMSTCFGVAIQFNASGAASYSWAPPTGLSSAVIPNPVANPTTTTTYTLTVTDVSGCADDDDITLTIFPAAVAEAGPPHSMCPGDTYQLQGSGGVSYLWTPATGLNDPTAPNPICSATTSTTYTLTVTDANGCIDDDQFVLTVFPAVNANAGMDQTIIVGSSTVMQGSGGVSYLWSPPTGLTDPTDPTTLVKPDSSTVYVLLATSANGCTGTDTVLIDVVQATLVDIPTAFTPNGDGLNDFFTIHLINDLILKRFTVYNRWGQIVFETTDPLQGWDGTYLNEPQPMGGYVYIVRGTGGRGEPIIRQGSVTLLR